MKNAPEGFAFSTTKNGIVTVTHHGRTASTLKGSAADKFLHFAQSASDEALQMRMAKLTGNYKRGNERMAKHKGR